MHEALAWRLDFKRQVAEFQRCRKAYGGDSLLRARLSLDRAVADLEALRIILRAPRMNLFGRGQGAAIARAYAVRYPEQVRLLALDEAPVLPDTVRAARMAGIALTKLIARCEHEPPCASRHAHFSRQITTILEAPARTISLPHPLTGSTQTLRFDSDTVRALLLQILWLPEASTALPSAIELAATGNFQGLVGLASLGWGPALQARLAYRSHLALCLEPDEVRTSTAPDPWGLLAYAHRLHTQRCTGLSPDRRSPIEPPAMAALDLGRLGPEVSSSPIRFPCIADAVHRVIETPSLRLPDFVCGQDATSSPWPLLRAPAS